MNNLDKKIYHKDEKSLLYLGDSFKILKQLDKKSVDLIFADPPYFLSSGGISCQNGKQAIVDKGDWDYTKTIEEKLKFHRKWISLCREVLKDNGTIMISSTLHSVYAIGVALEMEGFSIINNIVWKKTNPAPNIACRCFTHSTETIIWARKQLTLKKKGKHYFNYHEMKCENGGKQMKDVWEFEDVEPLIYELGTTPKKEKFFGKHPTQKPLELMKRLVVAASKEGAVILDPFNGSGSTGVAALMLDRKYIGIEKEKEFLDLTIKRFSDISNNKPKL